MKWSRRAFLAMTSGIAAAQALAAKSQAQKTDGNEAVTVRGMPGYRIHPAVGIARVGDSGGGLSDPFAAPETFYLAPQMIGGLPIEYDPQKPGEGREVEIFKDRAGRVRRQAAHFSIYRENGEGGSVPISLNDPEIAAIRWTVHVANKKAAWYDFSEFQGNLMLGPENSYAATGTPLRNRSIDDEAVRRERLIIDPGPRSVTKPGDVVHFDAKSAGSDAKPYLHPSFPGINGINQELGFTEGGLYPYPILSLGQMAMDREGGLLFLGGYGRAGGPRDKSISSFAGADGFFDDTSDGSVQAEITFRSGETLKLYAWVITGPPKVAPELVNITNLDDIIYDMAVRYKGAAPEIFDPASGMWNDDFIVNYSQEIRPLLERMQGYQWVADVAPMIAFASPRFDPADNRLANREARRRWFKHLRDPGDRPAWEFSPDHQIALGEDGFPLMPLNSGSNSVTNQQISKFVSLTPTQYFFFRQWAEGRFEIQGPRRTRFAPHPLDRAAVGNCVGAPMSPGIEVTWSTRNPALYEDDDPYRIKVQAVDVIAEQGLIPSRDETTGGGCQPGDLTKRMATPWQADFFLCAAQPVSFRDPLVNKVSEQSLIERLPPPPTFIAFWWPPQSPFMVYSGAQTADAQALDGAISLGQRARYQRGVNTFLQAILAWRYLGFVTNQNKGPDAKELPFFVESERNYAMFRAAKMEFTEDGTLRTDVATESVTSRMLSRLARLFHYYVGP